MLLMRKKVTTPAILQINKIFGFISPMSGHFTVFVSSKTNIVLDFEINKQSSPCKEYIQSSWIISNFDDKNTFSQVG